MALWVVKSPAFWHILDTYLAGSAWYSTNRCSVLRRGRSTTRSSLSARPAGASCKRTSRSRRACSSAPHELVREADDRGDWQAAGCSTSTQWLAQLSSSDYRTAHRITSTSDALRSLPALDEAMSTGALTLDQVAAAVPFATPESDAEIARIAIGKAPSQISRAGPHDRPAQGRRRPGALPAPRVAYDVDERRARARLQWTTAARTRRRVRAGHPRRRQAAARRRQEARHHSSSGSSPPRTRSSRSPATAATADGGPRRSPTTVIVHLSDDAPPMLEGAGPISPETAERLACDSRRLTIKLQDRDLVHSRVGRCASYPQQRALYKRSGGHCQYPGCTATRELEAHHLTRRRARRRDRRREHDPALLPPPQTPPRLRHPHQRHRRATHLHRTNPDARSPPTSHTHHPGDEAARLTPVRQPRTWAARG